MSSLDEIRKNINEVDEKMAKLFLERMKLSREVALIKKEQGLALVDKAREEQVLKRNSSYIEDEEIKEYYLEYQKKVMELSKDIQTKIINKKR